MSITLERCYSVNKYIYVNSVDCDDTYDECRDPATGDYGVYCDGTFYSRCWNGTDYSCVVGDGCCAEMVHCDYCGGDVPLYLQVVFTGIEHCGTGGAGDCENFNGVTFVVEFSSGSSVGCIWDAWFDVPSGVTRIIITYNASGCRVQMGRVALAVFYGTNAACDCDFDTCTITNTRTVPASCSSSVLYLGGEGESVVSPY